MKNSPRPLLPDVLSTRCASHRTRSRGNAWIVGLLILLAAGAAAPVRAAEIAAQEITVMTGQTESVVVGMLRIVSTPGESDATVTIPVLMPKAVAARAAVALAGAQPSLSVGAVLFRPSGFGDYTPTPRGLPRDWQAAVIQFRIPARIAGSGFTAKLMLVQPQFKNIVPYFPLLSPDAAAASKITFLPGNGSAVEMASRNTQPAALEDGMLTLRPTSRELILVRRLEMREPSRVAPEKKPAKKRIFFWTNPLKKLFRQDKGR